MTAATQVSGWTQVKTAAKLTLAVLLILLVIVARQWGRDQRVGREASDVLPQMQALQNSLHALADSSDIERLSRSIKDSEALYATLSNVSPPPDWTDMKWSVLQLQGLLQERGLDEATVKLISANYDELVDATIKALDEGRPSVADEAVARFRAFLIRQATPNPGSATM